MHGLAVYVKEELPFARDLSLENSADSYLCFRLALLHSMSYFFFLYRSPSSTFCTVFGSISSNIDKVLSINPSANVFAFGDFNVQDKDWLICPGETDRFGKLCYNFSISNDLTQMVDIPTQILDCDSYSPALLDLFISSDASIYFTMAFSPLENSDHVVVPVSIDFPSYSQWDAPFHHIAHDYSPADWDHLRDHLRDVPWEVVFKLSASAPASEFCEWVQVGSDRLVIVAKGFLKLPNMHILLKQKSPSLPRNLALGTFGKLPIVFSTKVNQLYLLYSMAQRSCLLHLIKQNFLLKIFLRTLILMTQASLYLFSLLELI